MILGHEQVQLLDLACLDMLAMLGRNRMGRIAPSATAMEEALDEVDIRYVSVTGEGSFPVTSGTRMPVTNSFMNAPQFDLIIVPGHFSTIELPISATSFLVSQFTSQNLLALVGVSSGAAHLAQTGILHKQRAAAPKCMLSALRSAYPDTFWQQSTWARHERIWTSNSAISALDMIAAWMREYYWDRAEAVEHALCAAGISIMDDDYNHCDY